MLEGVRHETTTANDDELINRTTETISRNNKAPISLPPPGFFRRERGPSDAAISSFYDPGELTEEPANGEESSMESDWDRASRPRGLLYPDPQVPNAGFITADWSLGCWFGVRVSV